MRLSNALFAAALLSVASADGVKLNQKRQETADPTPSIDDLLPSVSLPFIPSPTEGDSSTTTSVDDESTTTSEDTTSTPTTSEQESSTPTTPTTTTPTTTSPTSTPTITTPTTTPTSTPDEVSTSFTTESNEGTTTTRVVTVSNTRTTPTADATSTSSSASPSSTSGGALAENSSSGSGSGGISDQTRRTIIGVCVGVGGAIVLGAVLAVAWRLWGKKRNVVEEEDILMGQQHEKMGSLSMDAASGSGVGAGGTPSPFRSTLDQYHNPAAGPGGRTNHAANF